jgi:LacI family transcriptional regulator/LacI family repressor for deo operon, udp, cdd, tsx, nupC, and nupG
MHSDERIKGVRLAFSRHKLAFGDDDIVQAGARLEDGYEAGMRYFRDLPENQRPSAVTCYNDLVAIGLVHALHDLGLRVPDDISIVGYDDIDMATYGPIPLTTVHVPKRDMGSRAAELLIRHVESPESSGIERIFLEPELMTRASTRIIAKAPAASHE